MFSFIFDWLIEWVSDLYINVFIYFYLFMYYFMHLFVYVLFYAFMYVLFVELNALFFNAFLLEKMPLVYACTQSWLFYKRYSLKWEEHSLDAALLLTIQTFFSLTVLSLYFTIWTLFVSLYSGKKIQNCEFSQKVAITCYNLFLFCGFRRFVADVCQKTDELAE